MSRKIPLRISAGMQVNRSKGANRLFLFKNLLDKGSSKEFEPIIISEYDSPDFIGEAIHFNMTLH